MSGPSSSSELRAALDGVRAFLLDLDGVIVLKNELIAGAGEALAALDERAIPYRIVTNTSLVSRARLARFSARLGAPIQPDRITSALSASAAHTRQHHPGQPLFVLASEDALTEFDGQWLLTPDEARRPGATAAAVIVGDSPDAITYDNLNLAFRLVRGGADLIGMHRNPWWLTPDGPTLDSGAMVAGLEFATGRSARILGKPSPAFFREAAAELGAEVYAIDGRRLRRSEIAMVGDDVRTDVQAARRLGLRGVLVLTGKHGLADVEVATKRRGGGRPDAIASSLLEVVGAIS